MKDYIVTVMARDRVGIVRDASSALCELGGNITHLSQTVLRGYFTIIVSVEMPDERSLLEIRQAVERRGAVGELEVNVRPYEGQPQSANAASDRFILSMQGRDQKGIISQATRHLAEREVNVDDFYSYVHDDILLMLAQVSVPADVDVECMRQELELVGAQFGLTVHFQHEDIFRATGDVRPIVDLHRGIYDRTI